MYGGVWLLRALRLPSHCRHAGADADSRGGELRHVPADGTIPHESRPRCQFRAWVRAPRGRGLPRCAAASIVLACRRRVPGCGGAGGDVPPSGFEAGISCFLSAGARAAEGEAEVPARLEQTHAPPRPRRARAHRALRAASLHRPNGAVSRSRFQNRPQRAALPLRAHSHREPSVAWCVGVLRGWIYLVCTITGCEGAGRWAVGEADAGGCGAGGCVGFLGCVFGECVGDEGWGCLWEVDGVDEAVADECGG